MLTQARITDLGAIAEAVLPLHPGFTVLTGETGVGKTMLAVGLRLLAGGRGDSARVRGGAEKAVVEGTFELPSVDLLAPELREFLDSAGVDLGDEDVLVLRTLGKDGRSKAFIGGRMVPVGTLAQFAEPLLHVHGQHDQLRLLKADEQLAALDRFAGERVSSLLARWRTAHARFSSLRDQLAELRSDERGRAEEVARLTEGLARIAEVSPQPEEDVLLADEIRRLSDLDDLRERAHTAQLRLTGEDPTSARSSDGGAVAALGQVSSLLAGAQDPSLAELAERASEAGALVAELSLDLGAYLGELPDDSSALTTRLDRQAELKSLVRAYATDVDGVLVWTREAQERLARIGGGDEAIARVQAELDTARGLLAELAGKITKVRRKAAEELQKAVNEELAGLSMGGASLVATIAPTLVKPNDTVKPEEGAGSDEGLPAGNGVQVDGQWRRIGQNGTDEASFALKTAGSLDPVPLAKGASGGELSRIMLALELVLAQGKDQVTMVFDEVDSGVGGRAAVGIGQRLARLGTHCQVLAVTHLPQVAAYADAHVRIDAAGDSSESQVRSLTRPERVLELARMLAGLAETETGRAHAEELLGKAESDKRG